MLAKENYVLSNCFRHNFYKINILLNLRAKDIIFVGSMEFSDEVIVQSRPSVS